MVLGWVLVVVGLWGFFQDPILGIFATGALHNVIHLLSGAVLLGAAYMAGGAYARVTNLTLGIVYVLIALIGFALPALLQSIIDFGYTSGVSVFAVPDNWLHTLIAVTLVVASFAERDVSTRPHVGARG